MHEKAGAILRLFREQGDFLSGEAISRELNVSRTAVWKHISALRGSGYAIEAVPSRGYRLVAAPDVVNAEEVAAHCTTKVIGTRLICLSESVSTNSDAFRLAEEGAAEGTVVLAETQTGGKGRMGRRWASPPGVNLYCSIILRPGIMPFEAPQLTFLSAVAVARTIESLTSLAPWIKWPNDVLLGDRKVAGLLNEMSAETDGINFVILGIGLNINMRQEQFPTDLRYPATSLLLESGRVIPRVRAAAMLINELDRLYVQFRAQGFEPVRQEWQQRCMAAGRRVAVSDGDADIVSGLFTGIDSDGALLVKTDDGAITRILSGDVRVY